MSVQDPDVFALIDKVGTHYSSNIMNTYLRNYIFNMELERGDWEYINDIINIPEMRRNQGYSFHELYDRILALANFVHKARTELYPKLSGTRNSFGQIHKDAVLETMAINNFQSNLGILADYVNELYLKVVQLDKESHRVKPPVYTRIGSLKEIGNLLAG